MIVFLKFSVLVQPNNGDYEYFSLGDDLKICDYNSAPTLKSGKLRKK
jgi:hypothetical protein